MPAHTAGAIHKTAEGHDPHALDAVPYNSVAVPDSTAVTLLAWELLHSLLVGNELTPIILLKRTQLSITNTQLPTGSTILMHKEKHLPALRPLRPANPPTQHWRCEMEGGA